ncbi:MAG: IS21 family transposase, partial [Desulfobulbaceae bacterium]|nr:IS21 family transposase [Desulfobulbaceae bacterium]
DVEQANNRLKKAVEQALMLRQSKDFSSIDQYQAFLDKIIDQLNGNRQERFKEELAVLGRLPLSRLDAFKKYDIKVTQGSTIRVRKNAYSVHSRLIGEKVKVHVYGDRIELWYAQRLIETLPLLQGANKSYINYRHVIDILVRKPGAFEQYRYRDSLYPTIQFRLAYDRLRGQHSPLKANKQYLEILHLAAMGSQDRVNEAQHHLNNCQDEITPEAVKALLEASAYERVVRPPEVAALDLCCYDQLLEVRLEVGV